MSFPRLAVPEDTVKLYSRSKPVKLRPYLVGEEKLLLMAQQAVEQDANSKEVEKAIRQLIDRCTFGAIDAETLPLFDVEWLFLQLRAKSVNNIIEAQFRCINEVEDIGEGVLKPCGTLVPISIDIADIKMQVPNGHSNKVMLDDKTGIILKYPTTKTTLTDTVDTLCNCLESVFLASGEMFEAKDATAEEIRAFVEEMSLEQVGKIRTTFFDTMPRLAHTFTFTCPRCGHSEPVTLAGLTSFFD